MGLFSNVILGLFFDEIKGGQKKVAFLGQFFRPTSDVNISETVYPIYLKIKQLGEFCNVAVLLNNVAVSLHNVEKDTSSI